MKTRLLITGLIGIIAVLVIFIIGSNFAESKELMCLRLYQDINEISRTDEFALAEGETIQKHRNWIFEYVEKDCPNFLDLKFIYNNYKQNIPDPEPESMQSTEPLTTIEVFFGDKLYDGLVPVIFTEITTNAETLDEIMVWNFELIGHAGDDRRITWDILPKDKRIWYEITNDDGLDIRIPQDVMVPADLHLYEMDCGLFHTVEGESAHPTLIQIKNNNQNIFAKNAQKGIYPDSNGEYSFEFASIFEPHVDFSEDSVEIIYQESKNCKLTRNIEEDLEGKYTDGYYTKMVFRLESELSLIDRFEVVKDNVVFDVGYAVTGGIVEDIVYIANTNSLLITIDSIEEGNLILSIPRNLIDAKFDYCPPINPNPSDDAFFVLLDGEEILYEEILTTSAKRTLQIPFLENTSKIEIVATCLI